MISGEAAYILNTFSFLVHGFLVMWMAAGFAMLEAGLVRTKNTATICLKNIALYSGAVAMSFKKSVIFSPVGPLGGALVSTEPPYLVLLFVDDS